MKRLVTLSATCLLLVGMLSCKGTPKARSGARQPQTAEDVSASLSGAARPGSAVERSGRPSPEQSVVSPDPGVVGAVVVVVNDEIITKEEILSDLEPEFAKLASDTSYNEAGREAKRAELIRDHVRYRAERLLALQEARRRLSEQEQAKIERDVDYYVKGLIRELGSVAKLEKELAKEGKTIESKTTQEMERRMLAELWRDEISEQTFVRPAEMIAYYETHQADYHRKRGVRIRQIFLSYSGFADKAQTRQKGLDLLERLRKGEDFAHLAREYSQGPHAADGGLWEDFIEEGSGQLRPGVEEVAFRLRVKQTSLLIESEIGYHIIKVEDVRPERQIPFAEVQEEVAEILRDRKREARKREFIEKLWKDSYVQVRWQ